MPESIIVPEISDKYDLAFLYPLQQWLLGFDPYLQIGYWLLFAVVLSSVGYVFIVKPNFIDA